MLWVVVLWLVSYPCRALNRHFCWGLEAHTIWISNGPKRNLKGPSIEICTLPILPILGGPLGPQAKFHKGPIGFSGARGPYILAPESRALVILTQAGLVLYWKTLSPDRITSTDIFNQGLMQDWGGTWNIFNPSGMIWQYMQCNVKPCKLLTVNSPICNASLNHNRETSLKNFFEDAPFSNTMEWLCRPKGHWDHASWAGRTTLIMLLRSTSSDTFEKKKKSLCLKIKTVFPVWDNQYEDKTVWVDETIVFSL